MAPLDTKRAMVVVGTRPEAIKLAPVVRELRESGSFNATVVATGQHCEMVSEALEALDLVVDTWLKEEQSTELLPDLAGRVLSQLRVIIQEVRPDVVIVQGDTTSAVSAAMCAFYLGIPIVHVEAGLRSGDLLLPFPEEANRKMISALAKLNLAPTSGAKVNLLREGVPEERICVTGNSVIDALLYVVKNPSSWLNGDLELTGNYERYVLVTAHRRESWGDAMVGIGEAIATTANKHKDTLFVLPVHPNPLVQGSLLPPIANLENVLVTEPLGYRDLCKALAGCYFVLTDSGGIQEEAPSLGKPVLVMRSVTERPEGVEAGVAKLIGTNRNDIEAAVLALLDDVHAYKKMANRVSPYGDGHASARSVQAISHLLGHGSMPAPFEYLGEDCQAQFTDRCA